MTFSPTLFDSVETPALLIDRAQMMRNISMMAEFAVKAEVALRPHFKTSKMIEVARLQVQAGAVGFTCATMAEAEALLAAGINDVFWANAPASAQKARFAAEANQTARLAVGIDSVELAAVLSQAAVAAGSTIPVILEIDTGLARTGVLAAAADGVAADIAALPGILLDGVYMHEGQLASLKGTRDEIVAAGTGAASSLVAVAEQLRASGHTISVVSVGSTPGWESAPRVAGVTEARAGTYVFFDANQLRLGSALSAQCALTVLSTVVSVPAADRRVIDAGIKAMSSDRSNRGDTLGLVTAPEGALADNIVFERAYEEHGILNGTGIDALGFGSRVRIIPNHACGVVNMFSRVHVVEGSDVVDIWNPVGRH
ncbi:alanine racemase [Salinibacterium amurskyense]|uniref:alanine racemase n=1 Tax=Salinibacterium amurskyense TaxID=205941 RepID=UPI00311FF3A8